MTANLFRILLFSITVFFHTVCAAAAPVTADSQSSEEPDISYSPNLIPLPQETVSSQYSHCRLLENLIFLFRIPDKTTEKSPFRFSAELNTAPPAEALTLLNSEQSVNIKRQLEVADTVYRQVLGLINPLNQPRYKQAKFINVTYEHSDRPFGSAYDEVITTKQLGLSDCFIGMHLSSRVNPLYNVTPAHELFHIYQNGYTMFKQRWLTEGLARWAETLFRNKIPAADTPLPQTADELQAVMQLAYGADKMWFRLFAQINNHDAFKIPENIAHRSYVSGKPIVVNNQIHGTQFIAVLFNELALASKELAQKNGWPLYDWPEKRQRSAVYNPVIWAAIQNAVNKSVPADKQSKELQGFIRISLDN